MNSITMKNKCVGLARMSFASLLLSMWGCAHIGEVGTSTNSTGTQSAARETPTESSARQTISVTDRLCSAAQNGDLAAVTSLCKQKVPLNAQDDKSHTALMYAAASRQPNVVKTLLENGADPNIHLPDGITALMLAAQHGSVETIPYLVDAGAQVDAKTVDGKTALMFAAEAGDAKTLSSIVDNKADVKLTDNERGRRI
jgi:ankyrin repeat protein